MSERPALDGSAKEADSGAEDHVDLWTGFENVTKLGNGLEGGGHISIPVAHKVRVCIKGRQYTPPYCFGFAKIPRQIDKCAALRMITMEVLYDLQCRIAATIIDKHKQM